MMLEEINDLKDRQAQENAKAVVIPGNEDTYASMLTQFNVGKHKGKLPKVNSHEADRAQFDSNQQKMMDLLAEHGPMSRSHIAELLGVSPRSVSDYAKRLKYLRLVRLAGEKTPTAKYHLVVKEFCAATQNCQCLIIADMSSRMRR